MGLTNEPLQASGVCVKGFRCLRGFHGGGPGGALHRGLLDCPATVPGPGPEPVS